MLLEFASEVLTSNALSWVKNSNGMKNFKFFTIYRKNLKFLPSFYSFLPFLTFFGCLNLLDVVRIHFECGFDRGFDPFVLIVGIMSKL